MDGYKYFNRFAAKIYNFHSVSVKFIATWMKDLMMLVASNVQSLIIVAFLSFFVSAINDSIVFDILLQINKKGNEWRHNNNSLNIFHKH